MKQEQDSVNYELIGKNIKMLRLNNGLTQEKLAELVDITTSYVGQIERNERKISIDKLFKMSKIFDTSVDSIIGVNKKENIEDENMLREIIKVIDKYKKKY